MRAATKLSRVFSITPRKRQRSIAKASRRGIAAVEFATVAPLLVLLIFMMVEVSRYLMALHAVTGAARVAARATAIAGVSESDATIIAQEYMSASSFNSDSVTLDVDTDARTDINMNQVTCTVSIDFAAVSLVGDPFSIGANIVNGSSSMLAPIN